MQFVNLKLNNYRQYKNADINFPIDSVIGIIGSNGSGKSHLFEALAFSLTGTVAAKSNKADLIRWGANNGSVESTFIHDNIEWTVMRGLGNNKALLKNSDGLSISGIKNVNNYLAELLGIDKDLIHKAIFIPQNQLDAILFDDPAVRERSWQRLCGMVKTEMLHNKLKDFIDVLPASTDYTFQIEQLESSIKEFEKTLNDLGDIPDKSNISAKLDDIQKEISNTERLLGLIPELGSLQQELSIINKQLEGQNIKPDDLDKTINDIKNQMITKHKEIGDLKNKLEIAKRADSIKQDLAQLKDEQNKLPEYNIENIKHDIAKLKADLHALELERADFEVAKRKVKLQQDLAEGKNILDKLNKQKQSLPDIETASSKRQQIEMQINKIKGKIALYEQYLATPIDDSGISNCPICNSQVPADIIRANVSHNIESLKQKATALQEEYRQAEEEFNSLNSKYTECNTLISQVEQKIYVIEQQLNSLKTTDGIIFKYDNIEAYNKAIIEATQRLEQLDQQYNAALSTESKKKAIEMQIGTLSDGLKAIEAKFDNLDSAEIESAIKNLESGLNELSNKENTLMGIREQFSKRSVVVSKIEDITKQLNGADAPGLDNKLSELKLEKQKLFKEQEKINEADKLKALIANEKKKLEQLNNKINDSKTIEAKRKVLENVRQWFHYSNGPRAITIQVLRKLSNGINSFLEDFNSPYRIIADEANMLFRYYYIDGRYNPAEKPSVLELSGGEKVMLAIAFRFASYCMFADKLGVLALDEPTVYLDSKNISNFSAVLNQIKDTAAKLKLQTFISTHEKAVVEQLRDIIHVEQYH